MRQVEPGLHHEHRHDDTNINQSADGKSRPYAVLFPWSFNLADIGKKYGLFPLLLFQTKGLALR